jgi:peptidoglycan hydrolase-like protein with peptidoglycan-binding domain
MSLRSKWFRDDPRLNLCLVSDPHHVLINDRGEYVSLIQGALGILDSAKIAGAELRDKTYGPSTASAVLDYKSKRRIINYAYQKSADNIVGRKTIESLDNEMRVRENQQHSMLLSFSVSEPVVAKWAILSESNEDWVKWAKQVKAWHKSNVELITIGAKPTVAAAASALKKAAQAANGGFLIISVGHGYCPNQRAPDEGVFDLAPDGVMRISGRQSSFDFATVYYDEAKQKPNKSIKQDDEAVLSGAIAGSKEIAKTRLANWAVYEDICRTFVEAKLSAVVILTCKVGMAHVMLKTVAKQWQTHILAYKDYAGAYTQSNGRVRAHLKSDANRENMLGSTNIAWSEVCFPMSMGFTVHIVP